MFKDLRDTIKALNRDVADVANSERAKKLRKKLLAIGLPMAIGGFLGAFTCFALFATAGMGGSFARVIIPFLLFIPCGAVGSIGSVIASLGFKIVATGYTANLIDETVGNNCPSCGEPVSSEMHFCYKCGAKIKKECSYCKHINGYENNFCEKCGTELN